MSMFILNQIKKVDERVDVLVTRIEELMKRIADLEAQAAKPKPRVPRVAAVDDDIP